jgi:fluoroacetyl-CoA thioesterase
MANITIGASGEQKLLVTSEAAISFLGAEGARVLSTPHMIGWMERTCRDLVLPMLDPGHDTVGTQVNVSHLSAAPIGSIVTFTSEITAVEDRRVVFHVAARTEEELIGEGTHERAIINVAKFATRLAGKSQRNWATHGQAAPEGC